MAAARNLSSRLGKLRRMPPAEIAGRTKEAALVLYERLLFRAGRNPAGRPALRHAPQREPAFFFDPARREQLVDWLARERPDWIARARERADALLRDPRQRQPRWTSDPESGTPWPDRFYADIDIFAGAAGRGDVRLLWELNRHRGLVDLAKATFVTGDASYARACLELWDGWARDNPYGRGVNWASALEVAMRVVAWSWSWFLLGSRAGLDAARRTTLLARLHEHGVYLERHPSEYFSPNNHIVGEALALELLGALFPELPRAARWERLGRSWLEREIDRQFHTDGGNNEQATCYHHFSGGLLLQGALLRRAQGRPVSREHWAKLERIFDFSLHVTRPDGQVPMIGDNDDAVACPVGEGPGFDFRHYLAAGASLFGRGDLRHAAGDFSELAFWLLGPEGAAAFARLESAPPPVTSACFAETGYCLMRSGWDAEAHFLCFDCGPVADGVSSDGTPGSAHGHADALALEAAVFGRPVIVDPGIHSYNVDPDLLRYFRTTLSHATVEIDGASQSEFCGRLHWGRAANTRLELWVPGQGFDYAQASHDGYETGPEPLRHRRGVLFLHGWGWVVHDWLEGGGAHTADVNLPLAADVEVETLEGGLYARSGSAALQVELTGPGLSGPDVALGEAAGERRGWIGPAYGRAQPAPHVRFRFDLRGPASLWQVARPARQRLPPLTLEPRSADGVEALAFRTDDLRGLLLSATSATRPLRLGALETDAALVWVAAVPGAAQACGIVIEGSYVTWNGRDVWRSPTRTRSAGFELAAEDLDTCAAEDAGAPA